MIDLIQKRSGRRETLGSKPLTGEDGADGAQNARIVVNDKDNGLVGRVRNPRKPGIAHDTAGVWRWRKRHCRVHRSEILDLIDLIPDRVNALPGTSIDRGSVLQSSRGRGRLVAGQPLDVDAADEKTFTVNVHPSVCEMHGSRRQTDDILPGANSQHLNSLTTQIIVSSGSHAAAPGDVQPRLLDVGFESRRRSSSQHNSA
jgi:hypothetical protein